TTMALARGARLGGAQIIEGITVENVLLEGGKAAGVSTAQGDIKAKKVILAGGLWSRDIAKKIDIHLPLYACAMWVCTL
ncbi:MAG: FAD-dependent oxidoreductase, partial [Planctomycetes bacterium]|nr:FAD-dependent oxidoreductase [Planctomycetota bacterium]